MSNRHPELKEPHREESGNGAHEIPSCESIGSNAGRVWTYLNLHGRTSILKLKSEIQSSASLLHLSLGWLLREDKVRFSRKNGALFVELK